MRGQPRIKLALLAAVTIFAVSVYTLLLSQYQTFEFSPVSTEAHLLRRWEVHATATLKTNASLRRPDEAPLGIEDVAFAIKTFERPDCVSLVVQRLRELYPNNSIFVADDSAKAKWSVFAHDKRVNYFALPFDAGVGYGRNYLAEQARRAGFRLLVMMDDDYMLDSTFDLDYMVDVLQTTGADIIGADRCDSTVLPPLEPPLSNSLLQKMDSTCTRRSDASLLQVPLGVDADRKRSWGLIIEPHTSRHEEAYNGCYRTDLVQHCFIARIDSLMRSGWDNLLRTNDHYDFFMNAKAKGLKTYVCPQATFWHVKSHCSQMDGMTAPESITAPKKGIYAMARGERWPLYLPYIFEKWNLKWIFDERGKNITILNTTSVINNPSPVRVPVGKNFHDSLLSNLLHITMNSFRPAWDYAVVRKWMSVSETIISSCVRLVFMKGDVALDRSIFPSPPAITASVSMTVPADDMIGCDLATTLSQVTLSRLNPYLQSPSPIEFVVAHYNLVAFFRRMVMQLDEMNEVHPLHLTAVDFGTTEGDVELALKHARFGFDLIKVEGQNFSRAIGLSMAVERVRERRGRDDDPIIFAIDTSIVFTSSLAAQIKRYVHCDHTAFAPVVRKWIGPPSAEASLRVAMDQDSHVAWAHSGYGMVGLCLSDYDRAGGYDRKWGYRWGHEDVDLVYRLRTRAGLQLVRPLTSDMLHSEWKSPGQDRAGRGKNVYHAAKMPHFPPAIRVHDFPNFIRPVLMAALSHHNSEENIEMRELLAASSRADVLFWYDAEAPKSWFLFVIPTSSGDHVLLVRTGLYGAKLSFRQAGSPGSASQLAPSLPDPVVEAADAAAKLEEPQTAPTDALRMVWRRKVKKNFTPILLEEGMDDTDEA